MSYPAFHIYFYPLLGSSIITPDQNSPATSNQTTSVHKLSISTLFWAVLFQPHIKTHSITPKSNHLRPQIVSLISSLSSPVQSLNLADINFIRLENYCGGSGEKLQGISLWPSL